MKVAVVGAGAMGCLWGAMLARNDRNEVWLMHHRQSFVDAIRATGVLKVHFANGVEDIKVHASTKYDEPGKVDCVLIMVKAFMTAEVMKNVAQLLAPDTVVCTMQNGLGNIEAIQEHVPRDRILYGTTVTFSSVISDGEIRGEPNRPSNVWSASGQLSDKMQQIVTEFNTCGLPTNPTPDAEVMLWRKLAINCAVNPVTGILQLRIGDTWNEGDHACKELMLEIADEVSEVANAEGVSLDKATAEEAVIFVANHAAGHIASMCSDVLNERRTELEQLNGALLQRAKKHGINVPANKHVYALMKVFSATYQQRQKLQK